MKAWLDFTYGVGAQSGIGRYANRLARALAGAGGADDRFTLYYIDFLGRFSPGESCPECAADGRFSFAPAPRIPARVYERAWNVPLLRNLFRAGCRGADVYHVTSHAAIPTPRRKPFVCTIHDMAAWRFPGSAPMEKARRAIRMNALRADAIITDSAFSARDIEGFMPEAKGKVIPIHLGIDLDSYRPQTAESIAEMRRAIGIERPYILTVGLVHPSKNQAFLGKVLESLGRGDMDLVISGAPAHDSEKIEARLKSLKCANRIHLVGRVDDRWLPALYSGAEIYATSSLSEGFGFTPLEAMACGTPVISSNAGSLPEVLGDSASVMCDFDIDNWCGEIARLLDDSTYRNKAIARGKEQARRYAWRDTALKTLEVYRSVL